SDNGSLSKSLTAVRYVKSPIFERNSYVLLNGSRVNGSCPTLDKASELNRHISTNCGERRSLEFIASAVPILSCNKSILLDNSWNDRWYVFSAWIRTAFLSSCSLYPQKETPAIPSDNKTIAIHLPIKSHPFYLQNICFPILLICGLDHIHSDVAVSGLK